MKFTKFIPLVCVLALACPAFAAQGDPVSSEQTITVPAFINITKRAGAVETTSATFDDTYSTITLGTNLNVIFDVVTNVPTDKVKLSATAKEDGGQVNCLGGEVAALKIVFTNDSVTEGSPSGAITNALGNSPSLATNADAIAFNLTPTVTNDSASGCTAAPTGVLGADGVTYTFSKAGKCAFQYNMATSAVANTFDTHDTAGTYKATLTMSHVVTP